MSTNHHVKLPHPKRQGITNGTCDCGWVITYSWGGHGDAISSGADHIAQAAGSFAIELPYLNGNVDIIEGASL